MKQLQSDGIACAVIDLSEIGSLDVTPEQWYTGLIRHLISGFNLSSKVNLRIWWRQHDDLLSPVQRFSEFIEEVLLIEIAQKMVIFVDEIDSVLSLNFSMNDFFAFIRACHNKRVDNPDYKRLTFALLGVATPSDLIPDKKRTPFNIGRAIELHGFKFDQARHLAQGLEGKVSDPEAVLKVVLEWTSGQPFLTQRVCNLLMTSQLSIPKGQEVELVEKLIRSEIIENWESQDQQEHLKTIRHRIFTSKYTAQLLEIYQQILQSGEVLADDSRDQMELLLSGLVVKQQGKLKVYNRIYQAVFKQSWISETLERLQTRAKPSASEYQLAGSLPPDAPSYVTRQVDQELYEALKTGQFCYVLNSRQMGKSSLRVQTMRRLQAEGISCAVIDLSAMGSQDITPDQWYAGVIYSLVHSLNLSHFNLNNWWKAQNFLSPVQRLRKFIEEELLTSIDKKIVIFVDEIDSVLSLSFLTEDFFTLIRSFYNQRVDKPEYRRLIFCLLGVATPSDLIKDKQRTPFNIGRAIELKGFELHEAEPLVRGLVGKVSDPLSKLKQVLEWTGGQPFLTQKLCQLILDDERGLSVEELVLSQLIENWESQDEPEHLRTIRNRMLRNEQRAGRLLGLYQQILQQGEVAANDTSELMELRLSGLVVEQHSKLRVYNRIYEFVFNQTWVDQALADLRPYAEAIRAWLASNCKDESRLLRGKALEDAQQWAVGKNLSNDDHQFITASRTLESRVYQEALKLHTFKFTNGQASSVFELITLCDKYTDEAEDYLFNGYLETWLVGQGRTDLANMSRKIVSLYDRQKKSQGFERRQCLELFVRELCKDVALDPYPKMFIQPNMLYLGEMPIGYQKRMQLKIGNNGRGFAWGRVTLNSYLPGVRVPEDFDSCNETFYIQLDTLNVLPGEYQGHIVLHLEGLEYSCQISIRYTVSQLIISIEPSKLDLKVVPHDIDFTAGSFKVICQTSGGSLKGKVSTNIAELTVQPHSFKGADLKFDLILNTIFLRPGHHTAKISLETNNGNYEIPVQFRKKIRWRSLVISILHLIILIELPILIILLISYYILDNFIKSPDIIGFSKFSVGLLLVGVGLLLSIALALMNLKRGER